MSPALEVVFTIFNHTADGSGDVTRRVERERDFIVIVVKGFRHTERECRQSGIYAVKLAVSIKRILVDVFFVALPQHDADAVAKYSCGDDSACRRAEHACLRVFPQQNGQAAEVIQVAMREDDEVDGQIPHQIELRQSVPPQFFRMQSAIEKNAKVSDFCQEAIGTDIFGAIQVGNLHDGKTYGIINASANV